MSNAPESPARNQLNEQVEAFLSKGGEINEIPTGTTAWRQDNKKSPWAKPQGKKEEADSDAPPATPEAVAQ